MKSAFAKNRFLILNYGFISPSSITPYTKHDYVKNRSLEA